MSGKCWRGALRLVVEPEEEFPLKPNNLRLIASLLRIATSGGSDMRLSPIESLASVVAALQCPPQSVQVRLQTDSDVGIFR